ncbi:MAG: GNAT family N-acetyltransferase [Paracoccaceae bacterium]
MGLIIRPLLLTDRVQWSKLWADYLAFYKTTLPDAIVETAFGRIMDQNPAEFNGLIAQQNGKLIGLAHYLFHRNLWTIENTCYLMDLFVSPNLRGQGVGRALIISVQEQAHEASASSVYWLTEEHNYPGRTLYDKVAQKTDFIVYEINT